MAASNVRLASVLWRLRRATTMETGLFEIQAEHLRDYRENRRLLPDSRDVIHAVFQRRVAHGGSELEADTSVVEFARCILRLANLPNFALYRLSRYEASFWCQARRILFMLDALDRRKPQGHKKEKIGFGTSTIRNWARACQRTSQIRPVMSAFDP
jgi:hypothetical protein